MSRLTMKLQKCGMRQAGSSVEQIKQNNPEIWSHTKRINWLVGWFFICFFVVFFSKGTRTIEWSDAERNGHLHIKSESRQTAHFIKINSTSRETTEGETHSTLTSAKNGQASEGVNSEITSLTFSTCDDTVERIGSHRPAGSVFRARTWFCYNIQIHKKTLRNSIITKQPEKNAPKSFQTPY